MLDHLSTPYTSSSLNYPVNSGQTILLTGAGGYLGSALAKAITQSGPRLLILLDCKEPGLRGIQKELENIPSSPPIAAISGDVCDNLLLADLFRQYHPDLIYHAAAAKHVPLLETEPFTAVRNNSSGTVALARAAAQHSSRTLVMISTDKAANPRSIMGASKRIAELGLLRHSNEACCMKAVRLGNVFGSTGSVVPLFSEQIAQGGPVTVTHPLAKRYFFTLSAAMELIFSVASLAGPSGIFAPVPDEPVRILDLAHEMIHSSQAETSREISIRFTELRPGDKLTEEFYSSCESIEPTADPRLSRVCTPSLEPSEFDHSMSDLEQSILRNDLASLLAGIRRMVPEYEPSDTLLGLLRLDSA